ncbi:MAG: nucleotidyltransferase family protein [bacterium]
MRDIDAKIQKEDLFIKYCCQCEVDKEVKIKAEALLKDGLNWDYLLKNAEYQRIHLLLYLQIKKSGWEQLVPEGVINNLKRKYRNNTEKNLYMIGELKRLLGIFRENNIKVIVLKGIVLEKIISLGIEYKPIYDIDLLIHKDDRYRIGTLLKSDGYLPIPPKERVFWEEGYHHPDKGVAIDLHWHFFTVQEYQKITRIDMNEQWENAVAMEFEGIEILTLSLEDTLLTLCTHFSIHHIFCGLILLFEISEFIRKDKDQISWQDIISKAKRYRIKNSVYFTLYFAKTILNAPVPSFVLNRLKANWLRRLWLSRFLVNEEEILSLPTKLRDVRHQQWALCSWIISDSIIDFIKAFLVTRQILKVKYDE